MKTVRVVAVWESVHDVEVPDDFNADVEDVVDQLDCRHAELVDWSVT